MLVVLALVAGAVLAIQSASAIRERGSDGGLPHLSADVAGWQSSYGAPDWALPADPRETDARRRTYRKGSAEACVSVALFTRQGEPRRRASLDRIHPEKGVSRIEQLRVAVALNGSPRSAVDVPALLLHHDRQRVLIAYWHQRGGAVYGSQYRYRLAVLGDVLLRRPADATLVRIGVPLGASESVEGGRRTVAELAPALHAAVAGAMAPGSRGDR